MAVEVGELLARMKLDTSGMQAGVDKLDEYAREMSDHFDGMRSQVAGLIEAEEKQHALAQSIASGAVMTTAAITAVGVALLGVGVNATRMAINFETSFAGVKKTVDATIEEFAALSQGMRNLAQEIPVNVNELNKIGETAGALGIAKNNIIEFTKTISMIATTTNLTADNAATSFGRIATLMELSQQDFSKLGSAIVDLGNKGESTEAEIVTMANRLVGAGKTVGMTTAEILGLSASMANVGINAEKGGTAMSKLMIKIASDVATGGDAVKGWADVSGMSVDKFSTAFKTNAAGAIQAFIGGLSKIQESGGNLFGTLEDLGIKETRLRDTTLLLASAGDKLARDLNTSKTAWEANTALTVEAGKRYETTASQMTLFQNKLSNTQITLGTAFLPMMVKLMEAAEPFVQLLGNLATGFAGLDPKVQLAIAGFVGMMAGLGPVVLAAASFVRAVQTLMPLLTLIGGALATPAALFLGLAAACFIVWQNLDKLGAMTKTVADAFNAFVATGLNAMFNAVKNVATGIATAFVSMKDRSIEAVSLMVTAIKDWVGTRLTAVFDPLKAKIDSVKNWFRSLTDDVVTHSSVPDMVNGVDKHFKRFDAVMVRPTQQATQQVSNLFKQSGNAVKNLTGTIDDIQQFVGALSTMNGPEVVGAFQGLIGGLSSSVGSIGALGQAITAIGPLWTAVSALLVANPISATILGVAALAAAIYLNWENIKKWTEQLGSKIHEWATAFNKAVASVVDGGIKKVTDGFTGMKTAVIQVFTDMVNSIKEWMGGKLEGAMNSPAAKAVMGVINKFVEMKDKLVTHSVVPEMVGEIGVVMSTLPDQMVPPVSRAVANIQQHMETLEVGMSSAARRTAVGVGSILQGGTMTWTATMSSFATAATSTWGSLSQTVGTNLAKMTDEEVQWGEVTKQIGMQVLSTAITTAIGVMTQWAISGAGMVAAQIMSDSARVASATTADSIILASATTSAAGSTSVWGGAADLITGSFGSVAGGFSSIAGSLVEGVIAIGSFIMTVLGAIGSALSATVFGIPFAGAIFAGIALIAAALAMSGNLPFLAEGGIVNGPTLAMIGERGPEAVVPLDKAGGFGGGRGPANIVFMVDRKELSRMVFQELPDHVYVRTKLR